jgi:hypothetical protein
MSLFMKNLQGITLVLAVCSLAALITSDRANVAISNVLATWFSFETPYAVATGQRQELEELRESYEFQAESWEHAELMVAEHVTDVTISIETLIAHKMETIPEQVIPFSGSAKVISSSLFEVNELCNISSNLNKLGGDFAVSAGDSPITEECENWKNTIASVKLEAFELERELDNAAEQLSSASEAAIEDAIDFLCETFEVFCPAAEAEQKLY